MNEEVKKSSFKGILIVFGVIFIGIILAVFIIYKISVNSNKMTCKSSIGNITIMFNDKTLTGYYAKGLEYDLDGQKNIANRIGVGEYLNQFEEWFKSNTGGSCEQQRK